MQQASRATCHLLVRARAIFALHALITNGIRAHRVQDMEARILALENRAQHMRDAMKLLYKSKQMNKPLRSRRYIQLLNTPSDFAPLVLRSMEERVPFRMCVPVHPGFRPSVFVSPGP